MTDTPETPALPISALTVLAIAEETYLKGAMAEVDEWTRHNLYTGADMYALRQFVERGVQHATDALREKLVQAHARGELGE